MGLGAGMESRKEHNGRPSFLLQLLQCTAADAATVGAAVMIQTDALSTHVPALISPTGCTQKGQNSRMLAGEIDAMVQPGVLVLALDTEIAKWSLQVASTSGTAACSVATGGRGASRDQRGPDQGGPTLKFVLTGG